MFFRVYYFSTRLVRLEIYFILRYAGTFIFSRDFISSFFLRSQKVAFCYWGDLVRSKSNQMAGKGKGKSDKESRGNALNFRAIQTAGQQTHKGQQTTVPSIIFAREYHSVVCVLICYKNSLQIKGNDCIKYATTNYNACNQYHSSREKKKIVRAIRSVVRDH